MSGVSRTRCQYSRTAIKSVKHTKRPHLTWTVPKHPLQAAADRVTLLQQSLLLWLQITACSRPKLLQNKLQSEEPCHSPTTIARTRTRRGPELTRIGRSRQGAGRKVVHNTSVNADTKLYAYLPPEEAELDAEQIEKVLVPALLMQMRQQDTNYFATNPLQISGTYEARVGVDDTQVRTAVVVAHERPG